MASSSKTITAQCLCKAARFPISVDATSFPRPSGYCHCDSCRHVTGTLCNSDIYCSTESSFPFADSQALRRYEFSPRMHIYFCKTCGTILFWYTPDDGRLCVASSTIIEDDVDASRGNDKHMYVGDTKDGGLSIWLPRHDNGTELPSYVARPENGSLWKASERAGATDFQSKSETLHAYCLCRGTQFWLTRPDERSAQLDAEPSNLYRGDNNPPSKWWLDSERNRYLAGNCACNSCRLASGCEVVQWTFVPSHNIRLDETGSRPFSVPFGSLQSYESSDNVTRYFCGKCAAMVFWTSDNRKGLIDVAVGLLDAEEGARAETWLSWSPRTLSYREESEHKSSAVRELVKGLADSNV